jgi:hypothetical protein
MKNWFPLCDALSCLLATVLQRRSWVMHHAMVTSVDSRLPGINYDCKKIQILNAKNQVKALFWLWFWPLHQLTYSLNCHKSCNLACSRIYKSKMLLCVDYSWSVCLKCGISSNLACPRIYKSKMLLCVDYSWSVCLMCSISSNLACPRIYGSKMLICVDKLIGLFKLWHIL